MRFCIGVILVMLLSLCFCNGTVAGGDQGGSVITNGYVVSATGYPVAGAVVMAYPIGHVSPLPADSKYFRTETDSGGEFILETESNFTFNLIVLDSTSNSGTVLFTLAGDTSVGTVILSPSGSIEGSVNGESSDSSALFVGCRGTPFFSTVNPETGAFTLSAVPQGSYHVLVYSENRIPDEISAPICQDSSCGNIVSDTGPTVVSSDSTTSIELTIAVPNESE